MMISLPSNAISADLGREALSALFASTYIAQHVNPNMDIARGDADAVINKGFALADRVLKLRRM